VIQPIAYCYCDLIVVQQIAFEVSIFLSFSLIDGKALLVSFATIYCRETNEIENGALQIEI